MATELDDLFDALNRQADAIPLVGPERARQRGRQRTRTQALLSVTAVLLVVVAGLVGGLHGTTRQTTPATPHTTKSAPPSGNGPVPTVGKPIGTVDDPSEGRTVVVGGLAYAMWDRQGVLSVAGVDPRTGKELWPVQRVSGVPESLFEVVGVPGAVVWASPNHIYAFDTATGRRLWTRNGTDFWPDFTDKAIVNLDTRKSILTGIDWTTGATAWSIHIAGGAKYFASMRVPADAARLGSGVPTVLPSNQVVVVSDTGQAMLYDTQAGALLAEASIGAAPSQYMAAYGGWLYTVDMTHGQTAQQILRATDLTGGGKAGVVVARPRGNYVSISACGTLRVCVVTKPGSQAHLSGYAVPSGKLFANLDVKGDELVRTVNGKFLMSNWANTVSYIYDESGRQEYTAPGSLQWIDGNTPLVPVQDQIGNGTVLPWTRYSLTDGTVRALGKGPSADTGSCASTGDRFVCVTEKGVVDYVIG